MFLIMFLISSSSFSIYSLFLFCLLYSIILFHSIFFFLFSFFRSCSFNLLIPFYGSSQLRLLLLYYYYSVPLLMQFSKTCPYFSKKICHIPKCYLIIIFILCFLSFRVFRHLPPSYSSSSFLSPIISSLFSSFFLTVLFWLISLLLFSDFVSIRFSIICKMGIHQYKPSRDLSFIVCII